LFFLFCKKKKKRKKGKPFLFFKPFFFFFLEPEPFLSFFFSPFQGKERENDLFLGGLFSSDAFLFVSKRERKRGFPSFFFYIKKYIKKRKEKERERVFSEEGFPFSFFFFFFPFKKERKKKNRVPYKGDGKRLFFRCFLKPRNRSRPTSKELGIPKPFLLFFSFLKKEKRRREREVVV